MTRLIRLECIYDEEVYWKRVHRNLAWLGDTPEEQQERQKRFSDVTVGVAGCGGIGGACAVRLARMGIRHIKVADPDVFEWTNVNRQMGASKANLGKNKAEVVGQMVYELAGDVTVEIFPEGITKDNAREFVNGCDLVLDQMDFYLLGERYALHRAFRESLRTKYILSAWCIGWGTSLFKWTHEGMSLEEYFDIPEDTPLKGDVIIRLLSKFMPNKPPFPSIETIYDWFVNKHTVPLYAASPPIAEAAVIPQVALVVAGLEDAPFVTKLPAAPDCWVFDSMTLEGRFLRYEGGVHHAIDCHEG